MQFVGAMRSAQPRAGTEDRVKPRSIPGLYVALISITGLWSVFKGLVIQPHDYALAHFLLNYDEGFVRRAIIGALLSPTLRELSTPDARQVLIATAYLLLAITVGGIVAMAVRAPSQLRWPYAVFLASPAAWHWGLSLGYTDSLLAMIVIGCALLWRQQLFGAFMLAIVGTLFHESIGLLVATVWVVITLDDRKRWASWACIVALVAFTLFISRRLPTETLRIAMQSKGVCHPHWINVVIELLRYDALTMFHRIRNENPRLVALVVGNLVQWSIPGIWLGLIAATQYSGTRLGRLSRIIAPPLSVVALSMIAFDFARIYAWAAVVGMGICVGVDRSNRSATTINQPKVVQLSAMLLVAVFLLVPSEFTFSHPAAQWLPRSIAAHLWNGPAELRKRVVP